MKILEAQSAVLTNYEVYQHLTDQKARYTRQRRRGPPNLETVVRELLQYLRTYPGPLNQDPITYTPECISQLLKRLRPYDLAKAEVAMIFNNRPQSVAQLNTVVEDMEERFSVEEQREIIQAVTGVVGQFPTAGDTNGEEMQED